MEENNEKQGTGEVRLPPWDLPDVVRATLILLLVMLAIGVGYYFLKGVIKGESGGWLEGAALGALLLLQSVMMLYLSWRFGVKKYGGGIAGLGLKEFNIVRGLYYSIMFLVPLYVFEFLYGYVIEEWFGAKLPETDYVSMLGGGRLGTVLAAVLIVMIAPIAEEVFFRGFLYPAVKKRFGLFKGIVLGALIFALFHLDGWLILPVGLIGAINIYLYERTGSLDSCIILHSMNNLTALILLLTQGG